MCLRGKGDIILVRKVLREFRIQICLQNDKCAKIASLRKKDVADAIFQVKSAASKWKIFAEQVGVRPEMSSAIENYFVKYI